MRQRLTKREYLPYMSHNWLVHHFTNGIKLWVVQVAHKPDEAGPQHFFGEKQKCSKVKNEEHAKEPMESDGCAGRRAVRFHTLAQRCI